VSKASDVIQYGLAEVGDPYVYAAEGPSSFDCSGLMLYIFEKIGVKLPRTAAQQQKYATPIGAPQPGDLVFWGSPAYHVALYVGGGKVLTAPHTGANVRVENVWGSPTYGRIKGLGSSSPIAATAIGLATPIANTIDTQLKKIDDFGRLILFAGAGAVLIVLGAWRLTKGDNA
jgi:hypothetical protein